VLLTPGLQPGGIDDHRLVHLARELSKSGVTVLTPGFPELSGFEITPALTDSIEEAALWLATQPALAPSGRIGMMGVSFSAGLTVVAAGRPSLRHHVLYVLAIGGHDDLPRVLRYLATGIAEGAGSGSQQAWRRQRPHDYGVAMLMHTVAERMVPPDQVARLREGVARFVGASYLERHDRDRARSEFDAARAFARTLPEPSAFLLSDLLDRRVDRLGPRLLPYVSFYGEEPALSPSKSPLPSARVFLLHGARDSLIPAWESELLAARLRPHTRVRLLLTDVIAHAEPDRHATVLGVLGLAGIWADMLDE
jgi:hypothetical protein